LITTTVRSRSVLANDRLDAHFFTSPGVAAFERITMFEAAGDAGRISDVASVWDPPRFARAYAAPAEPGRPYLRPYNVFEYLPDTSDRLSTLRNQDVNRLVPKPGTLLQTCSGRNLGPLTIADDDLAGFALSHDMIRLEVDDEEDRLFLLTYLKTPTGQALLRRGKSGSVIDHITPADVEAVPLPVLPTDARDAVVAAMRRAVLSSASGRRRLRTVLAAQAAALPLPMPDPRHRTGWSCPSAGIRDRLDAAFYDLFVLAARDQVAQTGGLRLGDVAEATIPVRYKRYYVEAGFGRPVLSGRQILQSEPVNLRYVSDRSFKQPEKYIVTAGMTIMAADGRAQGGQGSASLVTADRDGWLASDHVMRLVPRPGVRPGQVWLAMAARQTRLQVNARSFGSVIDELTSEAVEDVLVPTVPSELAAEAETAWEDFAIAGSASASAISLLESALHCRARPRSRLCRPQ
jgi:hypothetical protein